MAEIALSFWAALALCAYVGGVRALYQRCGLRAMGWPFELGAAIAVWAHESAQLAAKLGGRKW